MPVVENLPDLSHWKTVQEFSITQAALLLAGIDPYDYANGLEGVREGANKQVISSQADSLIKISRIWA
ncbi:hypothetical protein ACK6VR_20150, partial [Escherichia coli]